MWGHWVKQSQVTQAPVPPSPAWCTSAPGYCTAGLKISWLSLICVWVTFLLPSLFSWQWVLRQLSHSPWRRLLFTPADVKHLGTTVWDCHCPLKTAVGRGPALLCLVVLKPGPFAWTGAQAFLQVQTFTLPLRAARVFSQDSLVYKTFCMKILVFLPSWSC